MPVHGFGDSHHEHDTCAHHINGSERERYNSGFRVDSVSIHCDRLCIFHTILDLTQGCHVCVCIQRVFSLASTIIHVLGGHQRPRNKVKMAQNDAQCSTRSPTDASQWGVGPIRPETPFLEGHANS